MRARGVRFVREPATHAYGTVAVFEDLYGNLWDLIGPSSSAAQTGASNVAGGLRQVPREPSHAYRDRWET